MSAFDLIEMKKRDYIRDVYQNGASHIYADTDSVYYEKENKNMRRNDYIVVHLEGRPAIITKSSIIGVRMSEVEGKAIIDATNSMSYFVDECYSNIVKGLFE